MSANDRVTLQCVRVSDGEPILHAGRQVCENCGEPVWYDPNMIGIAARQYPSRDVQFLCLQCRSVEPADLPPRQIWYLIEQGLSLDDIVHVFALAEVAAGRSFDDLEARLVADPMGPDAAHYILAAERAWQAVRAALDGIHRDP